MAMDLGLLYILVGLSFHYPSWQPWMTVKLTCSVVMLTWSYSTSWKLGHRTYNHYPWQEKQSPLQSFSLENEIFSDTSPLNLLLVSPKQTPTSLKILCQMAPTKKKGGVPFWVFLAFWAIAARLVVGSTRLQCWQGCYVCTCRKIAAQTVCTKSSG